MRDDFAIFILSHGRANKVHTVKLLERVNYTGKWYIIIDNEDKQAEDYYKNFGHDKVIMFNKEEIGKTFDIMDNFGGRGVITFARNAANIIAKDLGLKYFLEFEDDYTELKQRYIKEDGTFSAKWVGDFDAVCDEYIKFLEETGIYTVCFAQQGDFIGGITSSMWREQVKRKVMNSFFIKVDNPVSFYGRFNDDVNMYVQDGKRGKVMLTTRDIMLHQMTTQQNSGGITEAYQKYGTYVKSFYSVMLNPSCTQISTLGESVKEYSHMRYHHAVDWATAVPKIISSKFRKE